MGRSHLLLLLRIAISMASLATCLLLIALWARSYHSSDRLIGPLPRTHMFQAYTWQGTFHIVVSGPAYRMELWELYSSPVPKQSHGPNAPRQPSSFLGFRVRETQGIVHAAAPAWFLVALSIALPTAVWIDRIQWRRYSLRTLLIAMTIIAVLLGVFMAFLQ